MTNLLDLVNTYEDAAGESAERKIYTLAEMKKMAHEVVCLQDEIAGAEDKLKKLKQQLNGLLLNRLPEAMLGSDYDFGDKFETEDFSFRLEHMITGSWPKTPEKMAQAEEELCRLEGEDLIQTAVTTKFIPSEHEILLECTQALDKMEIPYQQTTMVNHSSLKKVARDKINAGHPVDCAKLGLYEAPRVVVKKLK